MASKLRAATVAKTPTSGWLPELAPTRFKERVSKNSYPEDPNAEVLSIEDDASPSVKGTKSRGSLELLSFSGESPVGVVGTRVSALLMMITRGRFL